MNLNVRNMSYDVIRIVALMMIVMVHVSAYMVIFFPNTSEPEWLVGNLFNGLVRAGVPMFVMLSGALLLKEDKAFDTKLFYKRNLLTMVFITVVWLVIYGLFYSFILPALEGKPIEMMDFLLFLFTFKGANYSHLWYMFMVIGMYVMIPVLRLFVKRENKQYIMGIIVASLIFQYGTTTLDFFTRNFYISFGDLLGKFYMQPATGFIGLLLLGWYLGEYMPQKRTRIILYFAGLAMLIASTLSVYFKIDDVPNIRDYMYEALTLPAFVYSAALFVFLKLLFCEKIHKANFWRRFQIAVSEFILFM